MAKSILMGIKKKIVAPAIFVIIAGLLAYLFWNHFILPTRPDSHGAAVRADHRSIPPEAQNIVRDKQAIIDRIPFSREAGAILDAICKMYLKKNFNGQNDPESINSALLMIVEDFPDSRLGGYACEKIVINDATLRQNVLKNIERVITERPAAPTNICLLSRYLYSPLPPSYQESRVNFSQRICESSAGNRAGYECMKFMASHYKSHNNTMKQAEYLELMLKHSPKQFMNDDFGSELARFYNTNVHYESLDKYESLLKTAGRDSNPGSFSDLEKLEYAVDVLKSEHKSASAEESNKAAFWQAYSKNNANGLISYVKQADRSKEYFMSLLALGDHEADSRGGRQYYEKIVAESEPFSAYSEQALSRLKSTMRPEDDLTSTAAGIVRLCTNENTAETAHAKTCAIFRAFGCSDPFIREAETYLRQYPAGKNAPDLRSALFIDCLKEKNNLNDALRYGRELFADPTNAGLYADTFVKYLEALAFARDYSEIIKSSTSAIPRVQGRDSKKLITRIAQLALFCQAMRNNTKAAQNGFKPSSDQGIYAVYNLENPSQVLGASNTKEILDELLDDSAYVFTTNDYASVKAFYRARDDHQALRILLSASDASRPDFLDELKYLSQNPTEMDLTFLSLLLCAYQKSEYYRTHAADEQTSAGTIYSLYCVAHVNNHSAGDEEKAVAELYECGNDVERLAKYESRHGDTFYSGKAAHLIAINKHHHNDYVGAMAIYKKLPTSHPAYGIKDASTISQQVSQYLALNYCTYLEKEANFYLDLGQYDNARTTANMARAIVNGMIEKPGSKKLAGIAAEKTKIVQTVLSACDTKTQSTSKNTPDIKNADLASFKRLIDSYRTVWIKLTDLKAQSEKYLKDNQLDDDITSLSDRYAASSKALEAQMKAYEDDLYQHRKDIEIPSVIESLGNIYELLNGFAACAEMYERYLEKCSDSGLRLRLLLVLAEKYDSNNSSNQAIRNYKQIVEEYPSDLTAAVAQKAVLTIYNEKLKLMDEAVEAGHFLYEHYPNTAEGREALFTVGKMYYENKKPQNAIYEFTRCLGIMSDEQEKNSIRLLIALSYLQLQDYDTCRAQLKEIINKSNVETVSAKAHYLMGYSYLVEQKYSEAKSEFEILQSRYPASNEAADAKSFVQKLSEGTKK